MTDTKADALGRTAKPGDPATKGGKDKDSKTNWAELMPMFLLGAIGLIVGVVTNLGIVGGLLLGGIAMLATPLLTKLLPKEWADKIQGFFGSMMGDPKALKAAIDTPEKVQSLLKGSGVKEEVVKELTGSAEQWQETLKALETVPGFEGGKLFSEIGGSVIGNLTSRTGALDSIRKTLAKPDVVRHVMNNIKDPGRRQQLFGAVLSMSGVREDLVRKIKMSDPKELIAAIDSINKGKTGTINLEALMQGKYEAFFTADSLAAMLKDDKLRGMMDNIIPTIDIVMETHGSRGAADPANTKMDQAISKAVQDLLTADGGKTFADLYKGPAGATIVTALQKVVSSVDPKDPKAAPSLAELVGKYKGIDTVIKTLNETDMKAVLKSAGFAEGAQLDSAMRAVNWLKAPNNSSEAGENYNITTAMLMLKDMQAEGAQPTKVFEKHRTAFKWTTDAAGTTTVAPGAEDALRLLVVNQSMFEKLVGGIEVEALRTRLIDNRAKLLGEVTGVEGIDFKKLALELGRTHTAENPVTLQGAILKSIPENLRGEIINGDLIKGMMARQQDIEAVLKIAGAKPADVTKIAGFIHENAAKWNIILGDTGMDKLAKLIVSDPDKAATLFENPASLFSDPTKSGLSAEGRKLLIELQDTVFERIQKGPDGDAAAKDDNDAVEKAFSELNFEKLGLAEAQQKFLDIFKVLVAKGADVKGLETNTGAGRVTNLDHMASQPRAVLYEIMNKLSAISAGKGGETPVLSTKAQKVVHGLDFDDPKMLELLKSIDLGMVGNALTGATTFAAKDLTEHQAYIEKMRVEAKKTGTEGDAARRVLQNQATFEKGVDEIINAALPSLGTEAVEPSR
ncbi:MAG: hypothetical protein MRY32_06700 [Rickettsiales bacterium]|nr:hypothetical protein [Rickettsiales bacterium]